MDVRTVAATSERWGSPPTFWRNPRHELGAGGASAEDVHCAMSDVDRQEDGEAKPTGEEPTENEALQSRARTLERSSRKLRR